MSNKRMDRAVLADAPNVSAHRASLRYDGGRGRANGEACGPDRNDGRRRLFHGMHLLVDLKASRKTETPNGFPPFGVWAGIELRKNQGETTSRCVPHLVISCPTLGLNAADGFAPPCMEWWGSSPSAPPTGIRRRGQAARDRSRNPPCASGSHAER